MWVSLSCFVCPLIPLENIRVRPLYGNVEIWNIRHEFIDVFWADLEKALSIQAMLEDKKRDVEYILEEKGEFSFVL